MPSMMVRDSARQRVSGEYIDGPPSSAAMAAASLGLWAVLSIATPVDSYAASGLAFVDRVTGVLGSAVAVSPSGSHAYVGGAGRVRAYQRDSATGTLMVLEPDAVLSVGGMSGSPVTAIVMSSDGAHLYAAFGSANGIVAFERDAGTGALTPVAEYIDGSGGINGLALVFGLAMSPDGSHLYAAGSGDDAVAVFSRDVGTGALAFVEVQRDGVSGVDGLALARRVAVEPGGAHVYATGEDDDAVAVFSRDAGTGALTFVEASSMG